MTIFTDMDELAEITSLLKSVANEKRLQILCILSNGEQSVGTLEKSVELSQSALSQHLARLRRDNIVDTRRDAQTIFYFISDKKVLDLLTYTCNAIRKKRA
jgi:DNA-binding transcriptional ArsR family regulator